MARGRRVPAGWPKPASVTNEVSRGPRCKVSDGPVSRGANPWGCSWPGVSGTTSWAMPHALMSQTASVTGVATGGEPNGAGSAGEAEPTSRRERGEPSSPLSTWCCPPSVPSKGPVTSLRRRAGTSRTFRAGEAGNVVTDGADPAWEAEPAVRVCLGGKPTVPGTVPYGGTVLRSSPAPSHPISAWEAATGATGGVDPAWEAGSMGEACLGDMLTVLCTVPSGRPALTSSAWPPQQPSAWEADGRAAGESGPAWEAEPRVR